jgi:predicted ATPase/DNA-binding SARP family transcriptional activator
MQVRILGPMEATFDGVLLPLGGSKQRIVLACLALRLGDVASVDDLIEAGWGDDLPANPANTVQYQVAQLRKTIEDDTADPKHLITSKAGYRLDPETVATDAQQFEESLAAARSAFEIGDHGLAALLVGEALALWRGSALADFRYDAFAQADAERLNDERIVAIELQLDIALADGRHAEASPRLAQLTQEHPLREGLWARRVLALYRSGRQSEALRVFQDARNALSEVGLEPGTELHELELRIVHKDESLVPESSRSPASPHNLPSPPNRLIGRQADVDKVAELLDVGRLVTLTGPGGAGKTRLAIAAARNVLDRQPGGVWFVPIDSLEDGSLLPAEIGRRTGMRENPDRTVLDTLADHLGSKKALLVLDNCEHLVEAVAALILDLTARCERLSVLATSQVVIETPGEIVFDVRPLATPGQTESIYDPITDIDGVALFMDRARDVGADVQDWDDAALAAVANIVSALDGMPLALELAAARTRSMSLDEIARGLTDRFAVLSRGPRTAPARQRSLLGAVEWSLNLLEDRQRVLMAQLSVLVRGFDADDAAAVTGQPVALVRDDLALLVDRSLLTRLGDVGGSARFAMLESLRQHGLIELAPEQVVWARNAHLVRFTEFAREADAGLRGADQINWLRRIDAAYDNIRAALTWTVEAGSVEVGIQLSAAMGRYWDWRGLLTEGFAWTGRLMALADGPVPGLPTTRSWHAFMAWEFGDLDAAQQSSDLALADATVLTDPFETAAALSTRILIDRSHGELESARSNGDEISRTAEAAGDPWLSAWADSAMATVALAADDLEAAAENARRSMQVFAEVGDRRGESWGHISLAQVALDYDDLDEAEFNARAALEAAASVEDDRSVLWALEILADAANRGGDTERSARLWGAAKPLRESRGLAGSVSKLSEPTDLGAVLRQTLGAHFDSQADSGRASPGAMIAEELAALRAARQM